MSPAHHFVYTPLTRTTTVFPVQSPSLRAWTTFPRASSLARGATESSRSMNTSSAGSEGALASIFGLDPGTERHDRRGRVTRSGNWFLPGRLILSARDRGHRDSAGAQSAELMPSPRIRRAVRIILSSGVLVGAVLGLLPPAIGAATPPTVARKVSVDTSSLVPPRAAAALAPGGRIRLGHTAWSARRVVCAPIRFTTLGVVWRQDGGEAVPARIAVGASGRFGPALEVEALPAEGPDPGTPDDAGLTGTPPVWTGEARCARLRLRLPKGDAIGDARVVFVNTSGTATTPSLLDRAGDLLARAWGMVTEPFAARGADAASPQPAIITRAEWGAKEKLRRCGPDYAEEGVKMAYVHHTVNGNSYAASRSDDLIRGIYAYHVQGRHFCDIAYNFLIDRFGRIFEGRFGGIDQPVIGAHAMGFNTGSTGVAALGTFTSATAPRKILRAFKRLLAWRLDVAHVRPTGKAVMISAGGSAQKFKKGQQVTLPVISGHRHTGYTTCPGSALFRKLGPIRRAAQAPGERIRPRSGRGRPPAPRPVRPFSRWW